MDARSWLEDVARDVLGAAQGAERIDLGYAGETSDFVRLNGPQVRQAGSVEQHRVTLSLTQGARRASAQVDLAGDVRADGERLRAHLAGLRAVVPALPEDPWLAVAEGEPDSETIGADTLPDPADVLDAVLGSVPPEGDLAGVYAAGAVRRAFASSTGQRNWHERHGFHLDWSLYRRSSDGVRDRAVKLALAGAAFDPGAFEAKARTGAQQLAVLGRPARRLAPGPYRVYLTPTALLEWMQMLAWGGFGLRAQRTKQTPLLRLLEGEARLDARVTVHEAIEGSLAPAFQEDGFARPARVPLIEGGAAAGSLVSPRSARQYAVEHNGAGEAEVPEALTVAGGDLAAADALAQLGTGLHVGNLWYMNFSDRVACRATGMTRFGTFWVEGGEIVAPVEVMRFDETAYRVLGSQLVALTTESELLADPSTYGGRSTSSWRLPGALVEAYALTL